MKTIVWLVIAAIILGMVLANISDSEAQLSCNQCQDDHCAKIESPPWTFNVEAWGENLSYIRRVEIKAGNACHVYHEDANDGCYNVTGLGGKIANVSKVGSGPTCHDVSHVLFYWWSPVLPTLTPTPTELPPTPTDTPGPTDTPVPTVTNTPPPNTTPTPTVPPSVTPTPPTNVTPTPTPPVPTLTIPPLPSPTPTIPPETPTPPPNPKAGYICGYMLCEGTDGQLYKSGYKLSIETDNLGTLEGYAWDDVGTVFCQRTAPKVGTTVLAAGPGECWRVHDKYPEILTRYHWPSQPKFGVDDVGRSGILCIAPCPDSSTRRLPESGGVVRLIRWNRR